MESFYVGAYWGPRQESSAECAERLADCVSRLGSLDEALASWYLKGRSKAAAREPVATDSGSLRVLLSQGRNRRDDDGSAFEDLGFRVGMWNRHPVAIGLSGTFGAYTRTPGLLNNFVLNLPAPEGDAARLYEPQTAQAVVSAIAQAWQPDWATLASPSLRTAQAPQPRQPVVGWMTYLSPQRTAGLSDLDVDTRPVGEGAVVCAAASAADVTADEVVALRDRLLEAGALAPT